MASLSVFDKAKTATKNWMRRLKIFRDNVIKHTTPITKSYFFKNENAADRVTLLGLWVNVLLSVSKFLGGIGETSDPSDKSQFTFSQLSTVLC